MTTDQRLDRLIRAKDSVRQAVMLVVVVSMTNLGRTMNAWSEAGAVAIVSVFR